MIAILAGILQDLRYGARTLLKRPTFTPAIVALRRE
jgi:hypothetical protein